MHGEGSMRRSREVEGRRKVKVIKGFVGEEEDFEIKMCLDR